MRCELSFLPVTRSIFIIFYPHRAIFYLLIILWQYSWFCALNQFCVRSKTMSTPVYSVTSNMTFCFFGDSRNVLVFEFVWWRHSAKLGIERQKQRPLMTVRKHVQIIWTKHAKLTANKVTRLVNTRWQHRCFRYNRNRPKCFLKLHGVGVCNDIRWYLTLVRGVLLLSVKEILSFYFNINNKHLLNHIPLSLLKWIVSFNCHFIGP